MTAHPSWRSALADRLGAIARRIRPCIARRRDESSGRRRGSHSLQYFYPFRLVLLIGNEALVA
jgi:hypothetical protein